MLYIYIIYQSVLITYIIILGNYQKAEKLYSKLLKRFRVELGESHPSIFAAMNFLAKCYNQNGKFREAEVLHKQA
jgi:tetratricopeptide (TPR) repeat protein